MGKETGLKDVPDTLLQRLSEYLTAKTGLQFLNKNRDNLHRNMISAMTDFGFEDVVGFVEWLLSTSPTQEQIEILASHLTVGETYFFREKNTFETLEHSMLPGLIDTRRKTDKRLRFWSAGCSTGEEAYSLAILIDRLIPDLRDWNVTIIATDINAFALRKAGEGIYSDWSFRDTPPFFKDKYFERVKENRYRLLPGIRKMVTFSYLNLSEDVYPSLQNNTNALDVILCRNVLMYFAPDYIRRTVERFYRSLVEGGFLIVSPVETSQVYYSQYATVRFRDSIFYKKDTLKEKQGYRVEKHVEKTISLPPAQKVKYGISKKLPHTKRYDLPKKPAVQVLTPNEEADALYRKGFYREAEERLGPIVSNGRSSPEALVLYTKILANQGKLADAFRWCEKAVSADRSNAYLHYLLAVILEEQRRFEDAKVSLKRAIYLDHNFALAYFALANLSLRLGRIAEARKHFNNTTEILSKYKPDEIIPESEGITARRFSEMISAVRL
ncbi:MAG: Chemotaxis protein methyltransferase Cher2 [Syntrophorhabdus sp. PtaU1.Bin058]|nr:MAG: Chemotaxis protein methyltransferase Cher2 [Syntrophorhabdus sp. PtaU1.Bin058]